MSAISNATKKPLCLISAIFVSIALSACGGDGSSGTDAEEEKIISEPSEPVGLGFEQHVALPKVSDPLPAVAFLTRSDGDGRFYRDSNPINYALRGINRIWQGTTDVWQTTAGDYTDEVNRYKAGDGPNPADAPNGQASDYRDPGTEIIDPEAWAANIQYVIGVTKARTEAQALRAFLDDIRSKNYSVIDGFGPLTEDYAENSGAYASFQPILISDVLENNRYAQPNNDSFSTFGGVIDSPLGEVVALARRLRNSFASTSGPKYLYGTPRPWRMTQTGTIEFIAVDSLMCVDGASDVREVKEYRIDRYVSEVSVIPGLYCGRRAHSSGHEADGLYSPQTENRRKDNGYPSGHTNAGILASIAYAYAMPERFAQLIARGSELGENRILAGMHSPVDVIGGRMQALMVAAYALTTEQDEAEAAYQRTREYFGTKAAALGMSLYDYATRVTENEGSMRHADGTLNVNVFNNNDYADYDKLKDDYAFRMTYGLPQNGTLGLPAIVPDGAEVLLKTRLPYLSDAQRRAVLASTQIASGYPLLDDSNGWGRINLIAAADGYAAFEGDVHVVMVRSEGGFSAQDTWRNDISGKGRLTKDGSGSLILEGDNSYEGGTLVVGGVLTARSSSAFGNGDVYLKSGEVNVDVAGGLALAGNFTQKSGVLTVALDDDDTQVSVAGVAYIKQGELILQADNQPIEQQQSFTILRAQKGLVGRFSRVSLAGHTVSLRYTENSVIATVSE